MASSREDRNSGWSKVMEKVGGSGIQHMVLSGNLSNY